jgi:permuted papain-like amidase YaeF/Yiix C92 family enzyme
MFDRLAEYISARIIRYLTKPTARYAPFFAPDPEVTRRALQPGDVVLIEGNTRLSAVIKFLTQSTWSHAALYVGERPGDRGPTHADAPGAEANVLLEAEAEGGVITSPLSKYAHFNMRICRPAGLDGEARQKVVDYALARIGTQYDTRQILDLARYLFPYPPVPVWFRRRMLAIGSGDPTRAICSVLVAEAFASIHYPILPERISLQGKTYGIAPFVQKEVDHIRRHGLYTPRDFDVSPYFEIIKPSLEGFDYRALMWQPPDVTASAIAAAEAASDAVDQPASARDATDRGRPEASTAT